jgi:hypothetical protein
LRKRLSETPQDIITAVENALPGGIGYYSSWRRSFDASGDYSSLAEWLQHAASPDGARASVSLFIRPDSLELLGSDIEGVVLSLANAAAPLFDYCYGEIEFDKSGSAAPEGVSIDHASGGGVVGGPGIDYASNSAGLEGQGSDFGDIPDVDQEESTVRSTVRPPLLAGATADTVPEPGNGRIRAADKLGIAKDVEMLVSVLLASNTPLPLAVGLFGGWGSGKSFFMAHMQERIIELSHRASQGSPDAWPYCKKVSQVRFNAWHYVDTNLWASLATTIFDQLASTDTPGIQLRTEGILKELDKARHGEENARKEREKAEKIADAAAKKANSIGAVALSSAGVAIRAVRDEPELLAKVDRVARDGEYLDRPAGGKDGNPQVTDLVDALGDINNVTGKFRAAWRLFHEEIRYRRLWKTVTFLLICAAGAAAAIAVTKMPGEVNAIVMVGSIALGLVPALSAALRIMHYAREAREKRELEYAEKRRELGAACVAEKKAQQRVHRYEQELVELRGRGAQLRKFVRERAASSTYRSELGIISQLRNDFEELSALLSGQHAADVDSGNEISGSFEDALPQIDRIILYVDDLDRCPPDKVMEVLQAVHLLLAFELFVVVVGVDSRWLERSLSSYYRQELLEEPVSYLEKIFQIPFALRPLSSGSYDDLASALTMPPDKHIFSEPEESVASTALEEEQDPSTAESSPSTGDRDDVGLESTDQALVGAASNTAIEDVGASLKQPLPLPPPEALILHKDERDLLSKVGLLASSPRSLKRLVNIYKILRVSVADSEIDDDFQPGGGDEYQVVALLLAVLVGRPSWAVEFFAQIEESENSDDIWNLLSKFHDASDSISKLQNDILITSVGPYRRWAPRVARFSFRCSLDLRKADRESAY